MRPSLEELATLTPPEDLPPDALVEITAADLRAFVALIPRTVSEPPFPPACHGYPTMRGAVECFRREARAIAAGDLATMRRFTLQWAESLVDFAREIEEQPKREGSEG